MHTTTGGLFSAGLNRLINLKAENMNLLQRLFGSRKPALNKPVVSGSLSFKEQMKQDIIPRVWQMAEKEKDHLNWLIDNNAPKDMIETSKRYLSHFRQRHKEYIEYADGL